MTREEFIQILEDIKGYSYEIEDAKIVITEDGDVYLDSMDEDEELKTLPPGVVFMNNGNVFLNFLETLPSGVVFRNEGDVNLDSLETLPSVVEFRNEANVNLYSLKTLSHGVVFRNGDDVNLDSLEKIPLGVGFKNGGDVNLGQIFRVWLQDWSGNIKGIASNRLLNVMISKGMFI